MTEPMARDAATEQTAELTAMLAPAYRALGELYLEPPTERTVHTIRQWCQAILESETELPQDIEAAANTVLSASEPLSELRASFTRLLQGVGYGSGYPEPPYESLYVDGVLNGPSSSQVEAFYLEAGVELAVDDELIDHAGYELAFLSELCESGTPDQQLGFIETHLDEWLPTYHEKALQNDPPTFYEGVFSLTEALLGLHEDAIKEEND